MTRPQGDSEELRFRRARRMVREALVIGAGSAMALGVVATPAGAAANLDVRPTTGLRAGSVIEVNWKTDASKNVIVRQCAVDNGLHCETRPERWVISSQAASPVNFTVRSAINDGTKVYRCDEANTCVVQVGFDVEIDQLGDRSQWLSVKEVKTATLSFNADGASGSTTGGSTTGASTTGGSTTGGSTTGVVTTGGRTTSGGSTSGGTTAGSTTGSNTSGAGTSGSTSGSGTAGGTSAITAPDPSVDPRYGAPADAGSEAFASYLVSVGIPRANANCTANTYAPQLTDDQWVELRDTPQYAPAGTERLMSESAQSCGISLGFES